MSVGVVVVVAWAQEYGVIGWGLFLAMSSLATLFVLRYGFPRSLHGEIAQLRVEVERQRINIEEILDSNAHLRQRVQALEFNRQAQEVHLARLQGEMGRAS